MSMGEVQTFIHSLRFHQLTSQQRKMLRGQAHAANLAAERKGLRRI